MSTAKGIRLTQGQFSFLPDLTDAQITRQIEYALSHKWALGIEYTDDPHPRNTYWELAGNPNFDLEDAADMLTAINQAREDHPNCYIRITAFDATRGTESLRMSYIVQRPAVEPGFRVVRQEVDGRNIRYTVESYAAQTPEGARY